MVKIILSIIIHDCDISIYTFVRNKEYNKNIDKKYIIRIIFIYMGEGNIPELIELKAIKEKNLGAILDSFVGNWKLINYYKTLIRKKWEEFLPKEIYDEKTRTFQTIHEGWSMAYVPRVSKRKTIIERMPRDRNGIEKQANWPYFILLLNNARDNRPQEKVPEGEDLLQKNNIDKGLVISKIDGGADGSDFYFGPNIYPYDFYASLLISKDKRPQGRVMKEDIVTWIKFSFLTDFSVFFNSVGAGASRTERFHAQVVDPDTLNCENKIWEYPIKNENLVERVSVGNGVRELRNYPAGALIFSGKEAPGRVSNLIEKIENINNTPYNILVDGTEIYLIPRNRAREKSDCIGKNVGGLECFGEIPVGNIEEPLLGQAGYDKIVHGEDVSSYLKYGIICDNISAACMSTNWLLDLI